MLWSQFSAIFDNFRQKMAFFSKTDVMIKILKILTLFWVKTPIFSLKFSAKIFKNHNIGPCIQFFNSYSVIKTNWIEHADVYRKLPHLYLSSFLKGSFFKRGFQAYGEN
jgi:hypothetical protein